MAHFEFVGRVKAFLFLPSFVAGLASDPRRMEAWLLLSMALSAQTLKTLRSPAETRDAEARKLLATLRQTVEFLANDYHHALHEQQSQTPRLQVKASSSGSRNLRLFAGALLVLCVAWHMEPRRLAALGLSCLIVTVTALLLSNRATSLSATSPGATSSGAEANVPGHDEGQVPHQEPREQVDHARVQEAVRAD
jgi:hypothetical protein